jgi:hypothetical protein
LWLDANPPSLEQPEYCPNVAHFKACAKAEPAA